MKISFIKPAPIKQGILVVCASKGPALSGSAAVVDKTCKGALTRALKVSRFAGDVGDMLEILVPTGLDASRVVLIGVGEPKHAEIATFEKLGGLLVARFQASGETQITFMLDDAGGPFACTPVAAALGIACGARLRSYRFDTYLTKEPPTKKPSLAKFFIMTSDFKAADAHTARTEAVMDGVALARDLVSEPANILYPKSFAERIRSGAADGLDVEILGERELKRLGMGALLGVAQGSAHEPQLVVMQWNGLGRKATRTPPVVLIGKGVTFDTGGISLKPPAGMEDMKWDMGGAAAVVGAMHTLAQRKAKAHVVGIVALVENMPSGVAQRPGDVVRSLSGQTVEVINTDAEGRLILCDAMTYAQNRFKPKTMVDLATLTGAMIIALGHEFGGLFSNSDDLAVHLATAGLSTGDKLWRFPLGEAYDKLISSPIADMKNVGPREAGSITAAQFLKRFVHEGVDWAHLDIAGMVWSSQDTALYPKGATGFGVRLLDRFIADYHEDQ